MHSIPDTHGAIRLKIGTDRAAGVIAQELVDTNKRWLIKSVWVELVTDATVATRQALFAVVQSGNEAFRIYANVTQLASLTRQYHFISGGPDRTAAVGTTIITQLPPNLILNETCQIQISAASFQAGDDFGAPTLWVEEWVED